jgi:hypothetical protein
MKPESVDNRDGNLNQHREARLGKAVYSWRYSARHARGFLSGDLVPLGSP